MKKMNTNAMRNTNGGGKYVCWYCGEKFEGLFAYFQCVFHQNFCSKKKY